MAWNLKSLLDAVPPTEPGSARVVSLRPTDHDAPPPALLPTWREIKATRKSIAEMEASKADAETRISTAIDEARQVLARIDRDIEKERRQLTDAQERWIMMTRDLGIDIQDDQGEPPNE